MTTSSPTPICPRCGNSLEENSIDGLCVRCLGALNFATDTALPEQGEKTAIPPFTIEELAVHFPQLEIIEFLGRGGMGVVYKARQKSLGRAVALKLLAPERADDPQFSKRFSQEAQALAALSHPNIVTIHDFGQAGGFYYLLMEFVDGVNLRQAMNAGRFTPEQALAIVPPVCEALQYAHEHKIVHRDIKPENLLLDKEGRVKIADFGIAKMLGAESVADMVESQPAGTPQYMAPEQKLHLQTDHRADIYSLGVVLYEMLTGELPADKLQPPSKRVQVDVRIDEIVLRALESKPELRFATAAEFRAKVETVTLDHIKEPTDTDSRGNSAMTPHFSRNAIIGACCIPVTLVAFVAVCFSLYYFRSGTSGISVIGLFPGLLLLIPSAFVTTILGWIAISQIRRSKSQVHGLQLAIFDALVYPLMAFNAVVALASVALAKMFVDFYANPALINNPHTGILTRLANWVDVNKEIVVFLAVATSVVVSVIIVRAVRRAVNSPVAAQPKWPITTGESNESTLVSIAMLLAIMSSVLGLLAAIRPGGVSWLFIVLSLFMASLAILMAMPARRFSAGRSAIVVAGLGIVIWPLVAIIMANDHSQSATVNQPPQPLRFTSPIEPTRGFPTGSHIGGNHHSVLVTHDQVDPILNYVFYYAGDFSTTSSGSQNLATMTWSDEGSVKLRNGRTFGYRREGLYPDELTVNGETFDLTSGRVLVLHNDSSLQQLRIFPPLAVAQSPERLAKYIANSEQVTGGDSESRKLMQPSPAGDWSPAMLELAKQVGASRADGVSSPDELIQWGEDREGLKLGLLIAGIVAPGGQLNSRLVIRNTSDGNIDQTLLLKGCVLKLLTRDSDRTTVETQISVVLVEAPDVPITLLPGEKIEMEARPIQFGGSIVPSGGTTYKVNTAPGFTFVKFQLDQPGRATLETGEATVFVDPFAARSTVTQMLAFTLHHKLASDMEVALRQVTKGSPAQKVTASPDDKTLFVSAYHNVMKRVRTFITVNDATDTLARGDTFDYPKQTPLVAARSFFHACAIQDAEEAISNLLSLEILAELRGDHSSQYQDFKASGVADPDWEAELRGDWPGKRERIRELVGQWNRYALVSLGEVHEVIDESNGEFILKAVFADAPDEDCLLSGIRCTKKLNEGEDSFCIDSLPPWSPQLATLAQKATSEEQFGPESNGIKCSVVALTPEVDDESPDLSRTVSNFVRSEQMTLGVELKNASDKVITLAGVRDNSVHETLNTATLAPHLFELLITEITDEARTPFQRSKREFYDAWPVLSGAATHEIAPGKSLTVVLRPAKFNSPMDYELPPGNYQVRVRYKGPDEALLEKTRQHWPDAPILKAWRHVVESNSVGFSIAEQSRRTATNDLVWGEEVDGLRAAIEFRVPEDVEGNPQTAPGVPVGTSIQVFFHVQNVSDKPVTFISETGRQGDTVYVTNQSGGRVDVQDAFFTGLPIDVAWTLRPGEVAELSLLTPSLGSLNQPGKYNVRYTIRFNSRRQTDENGKVIFPRPGDYDKELDTGETPFVLRELKLHISANGEIHGRLIDSETGKPVRDAVVACGAIINDSRKGGGSTTTTDSEGIYRLQVPSPGIYNVWLKTYRDSNATAAADDGILVEAGQVSASTLRLTRGLWVTGRIVEKDGSPVKNIMVNCYSAARPQSGGIQSFRTDDNGAFAFAVPPSRVHLYATKAVEKADGMPPGVGRSADAVVNVSTSEKSEPVTLTLEPRHSKFGSDEWLLRSTPGTQIMTHENRADVTGVVVDLSGSPIADVQLFKEEGPIFKSNELGEFRVVIDKGTQFVMHAFHPGYHVWFGTPTAGDELKIVLEKKPVQTLSSRTSEDINQINKQSTSALTEEVLDATGHAHMVVVDMPQRKDVTLTEQYVCRIEKPADDTQMNIYYNVSEARYLDYKAAKLDEHLDDLKVELILADGGKFSHPGKLVSMGAEANPATGNFTFRAEFPDPDRLLRPGMSANLLVSRVQKEAIVIPQKATFETLNKRYVYVVDEDGAARRREIDIQSETDDVFVVKSGLDMSDKIVVNGVRVLLDGEHEH